MRPVTRAPTAAFHFAVIAAIVTLGCKSDSLPPPQNLSYVWTDCFHIQVTWQEPEIYNTCLTLSYQYWKSMGPVMCRNTAEEKRRMVWESCLTTEDIGPAGLSYTIIAECGSLNKSEPAAVIIAPFVEMVKDFECFLCSSNAMTCYWIPANHTSDLKVFYWSCSKPHNQTLSECKSEGPRMRCHLPNIATDEYVCILITGASNGKPVNNTFTRNPISKIKMPAPELNLTEIGDDLMLNWTPAPTPGKDCWNYIVYYNVCGHAKEIEAEPHSVKLPYDKGCQYKVQVKGVILDSCGAGGRDISKVVTYGEDAAPDRTIIVILTVIPACVSACVILACYCLRRKQKKIFSDVPDPSVLLKEMMISGHQPEKASQVYIPVQEDMGLCTITPPVDRQQLGLPYHFH